MGHDMLDGLAILSKEAGIIVTSDHGPVGENKRPFEKFSDFAKRAERRLDDGTQLMLMKLCYVDIEPRTDVDALIAAYRQAIERIRRARPNVRIVHVTVPLCSRQTDMKSKMNRVLGRAVWGDQANAKRLEFNQKLLVAFPDDPCFDLAGVESARPDGTIEEYLVDSRSVPMLWPGYSRDGGHLNDLGKRVVAKAFVHELAEALRN